MAELVMVGGVHLRKEGVLAVQRYVITLGGMYPLSSGVWVTYETGPRVEIPGVTVAAVLEALGLAGEVAS